MAEHKSPIACPRCEDVAAVLEDERHLNRMLHQERERILGHLGLPVTGPGACLDGYPDLSSRVAKALGKKESAHA